MSTPYRIESLMRLPTIYRYRVSPDGERVAFVRDTDGTKELFVHDARTDSIEQISDGHLQQTAPGPIMWAPNGDKLYFQEAPTRDTKRISTIDLDGRTDPVLGFEHAATVHLEDVSPDSHHLLYHLRETGTEPLDRDLFLYNRETDQRTQLTAHDPPIRSRNLFSPDATRVSYQVFRPDNSDAYVLTLADRSVRQLDLGDGPSDSGIVDWHPDGDRVLVTDDATGVTRPGVYDLRDDSVRWYGRNEHSVFPWAFRPDGTGFLAGHYREVTTVPALYTLGGESKELPLQAGVAGYPTWVRPYPEIFPDARTAVFVYATEAQPPALVACDLVSGKVKQLVEPAYRKLSRESFVEADYITYDSIDGLEIGALLYRAPTNPSPAIVHIHGGPRARAERNFEPHGKYAQFFVNCGYTVLQPNFRGSTGRGRDFRMRIEGDTGGGDAADVAEGARWLRDREWIDDRRIGVFGQSYGAYGVFTQLTKHPDLWTAGIAWNGSPSGGAYDAFQHVDSFEGPLLMLAGEHDPTLEEMRLFRDALADAGYDDGIDYQLELLEGEGHHSRDLDHQIDRFRRIQSFLNAHV